VSILTDNLNDALPPNGPYYDLIGGYGKISFGGPWEGPAAPNEAPVYVSSLNNDQEALACVGGCLLFKDHGKDFSFRSLSNSIIIDPKAGTSYSKLEFTFKYFFFTAGNFTLSFADTTVVHLVSISSPPESALITPVIASGTVAGKFTAGSSYPILFKAPVGTKIAIQNLLVATA